MTLLVRVLPQDGASPQSFKVELQHCGIIVGEPLSERSGYLEAVISNVGLTLCRDHSPSPTTSARDNQSALFITVREGKERIVIIDLKGTLLDDIETATALKTISTTVDSSRHCLLNCLGLTKLEPDCIRHLVALHESFLNAGRSLGFYNIPKDMMKKIKANEFQSILQIYDTEAQGIKALNEFPSPPAHTKKIGEQKRLES